MIQTESYSRVWSIRDKAERGFDEGGEVLGRWFDFSFFHIFACLLWYGIYTWFSDAILRRRGSGKELSTPVQLVP